MIPPSACLPKAGQHEDSSAQNQTAKGRPAIGGPKQVGG